MSLQGKQKIKMAQVITRLDWSGAPDILEIICGHLDPSVYEITLIYGPTRYPSEKTKEFLSKFRGRIIIIPYLKREVSLFQDLAALIRLYFIFLRERFDIVHTHTAKAGFIGRIAAKLSGARLVIHTPHGHDFYGYFGSLGSRFVIILERIAALFADKIIVFTGIEKMDMLKYHICGAGKIKVIQSGLDFSRFDKVTADTIEKKAEFGIGPDDFIVGMVGRLESIKGCEYFIDAAKIVLGVFPQARFLVVGDGSLRNSLEERSRSLNMEKNVIFAGWREDIPKILPILNVLVLASLNEAVGRVLLEAGAVGIPTVATAVGGIPEVIKDGKTGILVPPEDAKAMARAVIDLLKDKDKRSAMSSAARDWVRSNFNEKRMAGDISNLYKEFAQR